MINGEKQQMPIWNGTDGYFFEEFEPINTQKTVLDSGVYSFVFRPECATDDRETAIGGVGGAQSGLQVKIRLAWNGEDGRRVKKDLTYSDAFFDKVYAQNKAFSVKISNYGSFVERDLTLQVVVYSTEFEMEIVSPESRVGEV